MRIAQRKVRLPPLAERVEEIAYLAVAAVAHAAAASGGAPLPINVRAFEACVLRDWTGENVRGVRNSLGQAYERAVDAGGDGDRGEASAACDDGFDRAGGDGVGVNASLRTTE